MQKQPWLKPRRDLSAEDAHTVSFSLLQVCAAKAILPTLLPLGSNQIHHASWSEEQTPCSSESPTGQRLPQTPRRRPPSTGGLSAHGSCVSDDKSANLKSEEILSEASLFTEPLSDEFQCPTEMLEWFILRKFHLKQLFTREEMLKAIDWRFGHKFPEIFKSACEHLEAVFAVEVREVESTRHSYNLVSKLNLPNNGRVRPGRGYPKTGLLMKILAVILMKGHCAAEEDIWKFLKKMRVYPGKKHIMFGDAKKLLTQDFVRLKYLVYRQVPGSDPPRHEFLWGPQAHAETIKEKVLEFLTRIDKISPTFFSSLYDDTMEEEMEKVQTTLSAEPVSTGYPIPVLEPTYRGASPTPYDDFGY
ncbi:melanoma-associated antigen B5-like [Erethizon dorsatum]